MFGVFFFFKHKTAYEMRISDWSSDVCSSDLAFFVRLAKCNLACSFCDTYFDNGDWFTVDELMKEVNSAIADHFGGFVPPYMAGEKKEAVFVLSGGEPMLQKNIKQLDRKSTRLNSSH